MVSASLYFHFTMFDLQRPTPVQSLFRHFQCYHGALVHGTRSSDGMDVSFCGRDRRWWVHALSLSAGGVYQEVWHNARSYFLTSGVCLWARDCIWITSANGQPGNLSTDNVQALRATRNNGRKGADYEGDTTCDCGVLSENTRHMMECQLLAHSCSLDDLLQFNEAGKQCVEQWKTEVWWHEEE